MFQWGQRLKVVNVHAGWGFATVVKVLALGDGSDEVLVGGYMSTYQPPVLPDLSIAGTGQPSREQYAAIVLWVHPEEK